MSTQPARIIMRSTGSPPMHTVTPTPRPIPGWQVRVKNDGCDTVCVIRLVDLRSSSPPLRGRDAVTKYPVGRAVLEPTMYS
jgi:hypothetical protein